MKTCMCIAQIAILSLCLWWMKIHVAWQTVLELCTQVSLGKLLVVFAQRYLPWMGLGLRLCFLFPQQCSIESGFKASLLCVGCNTIIPARMGELVKIVWLQGVTQLPYPYLFGGVFVERLLDVTMLLLLCLMFASTFINTPVVFVLGCGIAALWGLILLVTNIKSCQKRLFSLPLPQSLSVIGGKVCTALQEFTGSPIFLRVVLSTVLVWGMNYVHVALLTNCLMGLGLSWLEIGLLCVVIFFSSALLLAPGGVGVMEASVITVLCLLDVTMEQAVSTAVFARIFYSFPSALGAVCVCLGTRRSFFASVQELSQQVQNLRQKKPLLRNR